MNGEESLAPYQGNYSTVGWHSSMPQSTRTLKVVQCKQEQTQSPPVVLFYPIDTGNRSVVCLEEEEVWWCPFLQENDQNTVKWICSDGSQLWKSWKLVDSPKYMPGKP